MREIKFRAWDKKNREMWEVVVLNFRESTVCVNSPLGRQFTHLNENIELMQYTGLKDKNGVEIYEGDVVRSGNPEYWSRRDSPTTEEDIRLWGGGTAKVVQTGWTFYMEEIDCGDWTFNGPEGEEWNPGNVEVLGNVYSNPELLTKSVAVEEKVVA